jgi:hypothetical protein
MCISSLVNYLSLIIVQEAGSIDPLTLNATGRASFTENGALSLWLQFRQPGGKSSAFSLLPQGLYVKIGELALATSDLEIILIILQRSPQ